MDSDALETLQAAPTAQPRRGTSHDAPTCGAGLGDRPLGQPPINDCRRELNAILAALDDA